ncbi:MAG TPA: alpha-glucosidase C-terminal domain-containing protein, partial [Pyrinomonadaceae bacterium]
TRHVVAQSADDSSLLNFYKKMIRLRRQSIALLDGDYAAVGTSPHIYAYLRRAGGQTMLVALNMSAEQRTLSLDDAALGKTSGLRVRLSNGVRAAATIDGQTLSLAPFEAVVLELTAR